MKLPAAPWQDRPGMAGLLETLGAAAGETRFVGGCVRDTLLGLDVSDVDLATRIEPAAVMARLHEAGIKSVPTGIAHGTVTAILEGWPVEITTLRRDVATDGRRATIAFTQDWREDAARRDFTINAMSAEPGDLALFDYFDGIADIEARKVRFIGDPLTRIAEDHLRILRFFRFHARFGANPPDERSFDSCVRRANDLMALSRERIADELLKLLALPAPASTLGLMIGAGIFRPILPEIVTADRLQALVEAERQAGIAAHPIRRLAALLPADAEIAAVIAGRLRLSKRQAKRLILATDPALDEPELLAYSIGSEAAVDRFLLAGRTDPPIADLAGWTRPRLPIGGGDLIRMGLEAGPRVAGTLQEIERIWARSGFPTDRIMVRAMAQRLVDQALRASP